MSYNRKLSRIRTRTARVEGKRTDHYDPNFMKVLHSYHTDTKSILFETITTYALNLKLN